LAEDVPGRYFRIDSPGLVDADSEAKPARHGRGFVGRVVREVRNLYFACAQRKAHRSCGKEYVGGDEGADEKQ
jgi:hypothetical protein